MIAGTPADPDAEQPYVDPSFMPHGGWDEGPTPRRADATENAAEAHGVEATTVEVAERVDAHDAPASDRAWEIKSAPAQEPSPAPQADSAVASTVTDVPAETPKPVSEPTHVAPISAPPASEPAAPEPATDEPKTTDTVALEAEPKVTEPPASSAPEEPPRRGWWQRRFGGA